MKLAYTIEKMELKDKIEALKNNIALSKCAVQAQIDELVQDGRPDDAKAYRAAYNIYDVFVALIETAEKKAVVEASADEDAVFVQEFTKLATNIPARWRATLEQARKFNDAEKIMIEEAKLQSVDAIMAKFEELF